MDNHPAPMACLQQAGAPSIGGELEPPRPPRGENYSLFSPPPPMYSDEELEAWGELYCKLMLHTRGALPFVQFMALPPVARRACLRAALRGE